MSDGRVEFDIVGNDKDINKTIKSVTGNIQSESKKWDKAANESTENIGNGFSSMLKKIGGAIVAAKIGQKLLQIGKDAIQLASDLEEVQNVVDTTFGSGAKQIENWAKTAGTQFGLTELQAKKFASTMGAMMKSSGLAGDQIVEMSTDLAGLAADMASFYNLNFDEAFQKIRSGISGETEPLKQLGINMSVANLNAFALQQGLKKTFEQMSQSEQVMLRYQYLMQATADAQGDFAKTADGYANSARTIETNIETLKSTLGTLIEGPLNSLLNKVNDLLSPGEKKRTVFDDINDIQIETEEKVAKIKAIADKANELSILLETIGGSDADTVIANIANGANILDSSSPNTWKALAGALKNVDGLQNLFGSGNAKKNIEDLAEALSSTTLDSTKADAWKTFLGALSENADAVSKLTGKSVEETQKWLEGLATAADTLDPADADAWDKLLSSLVSGISTETPEGQKFVESLATQFLAMGKDSADAVKGLSSLGFSTDQISEKQEAWLKTCKELVKTIPGLSDIINIETGEIKGGTGALNQYVKEWQQSQEKLARWKAYYQMKEKLDQANGNLYELEMTKNAYRRLFLEENPNFDLTGYEDAEGALGDLLSGGGWGTYGKKYAEAIDNYSRAADGAAASSRVLDAVYKDLVDDFGEMTEEEANAEEALTLLQRAAKGEADSMAVVEDAVNSADEALRTMADHVQEAYDKILSSIDQVVHGFEQIDYTYAEEQKKISQLAEQQAEYEVGSAEWKKIQHQIDEINASMASSGGMKEALDTQSKYLDAYMETLEKARTLGVSDELLASLSDGSVESFHYLEALVAGGAENAQEIDKQWRQVQGKKEELAKALTDQKLTVDQVYQEMMDKAKEAVAGLNLGEEAKENSGKTIAGIAQGIASEVPAVQEAVNSILAELNRLNGWGINLNLGSAGGLFLNTGTQVQDNGTVIDSHYHETGLDMVPFDGYLASLHEGEGILTAEENRIWQRFKNGGSQGFDYDTMGGVMRDNIKAGGNVYLDGQTVGRVISDMQGRSYRQLQRSGWQG